jgi:hypothetical protein
MHRWMKLPSDAAALLLLTRTTARKQVKQPAAQMKQTFLRLIDIAPS